MSVTVEKDKKYVANTYNRFPVCIKEGKGSLLYGEDGKEYIDMGSGIAVSTFGAADEEWLKAVKKQLDLFAHTSNLYYSSPCADLAEMLCERTGMKKVFFANSGAEANECAIKAARRWAALHKGDDYFNIITLKNSFHGRTLTTLAATGQENFHKDFLPLTEGFCYCAPNDSEMLKMLVSTNKCAAIMIEVVQGESGVNALDKEFVRTIDEIARKENILIIADEVQCGNGRCGALYAYMNYEITPDIVTTAKGLAGGLPLGACMLGEKTEDVFSPGLHGSTFGGNPVCCSGAINILSRIDDKLLGEVREKGNIIKKELTGSSGIKNVTGMGLMIGIETEKEAPVIVNECIKNGVLVLTAKNKVRLLPPLNIEKELLIKALGIIKGVCAK